MANLVKINDVRLYVCTSGNTAANVNAAIASVEAAKVKNTLMLYNDVNAHSGVFNAINSWHFGKDNTESANVSEFPFMTWQECYDDFSTCLQIAVGESAIANSAPLVDVSIVS